jgi:tellurite resistance protein TehA-like permease
MTVKDFYNSTEDFDWCSFRVHLGNHSNHYFANALYVFCTICDIKCTLGALHAAEKKVNIYTEV